MFFCLPLPPTVCSSALPHQIHHLCKMSSPCQHQPLPSDIFCLFLGPVSAGESSAKSALYIIAASPSLSLSITSPVPSKSMSAPAIQAISCFHLLPVWCLAEETMNSFSTRMKGHWSSTKNPDNLFLEVAVYSKFCQLPFNSCWNVHVLQNLLPTPIRLPGAILN